MTLPQSVQRALPYPERPSAPLEPPSEAAFRAAMRHLPSGVCIITTGQGPGRSTLTATTSSSLSVEPPTILLSVNRGSSGYPTLARSGVFGVNVLSADHDEAASCFVGGVQDTERYESRRWFTLKSGVWLLSNALAAFDCEVEEIIERQTHANVVGRVKGLTAPRGSSASTHWRGAGDRIGWSH